MKSMKPPHQLWCAAVTLGSTVAMFAATGNAAEPEPEKGFKVGNLMPFHVVDFYGTESRGGCPSVMISNSRKIGVEIWSRSLNDATFQLAAELQNVLPKGNKPNTFLVLFARRMTEEVQAASEKFELNHCLVSTPRSSTKEFLNAADPDGKHATIVFVEDRKLIKAVWQFPPGALTEKAIAAVVDGTKKLLPETPQTP